MALLSFKNNDSRRVRKSYGKFDREKGLAMQSQDPSYISGYKSKKRNPRPQMSNREAIAFEFAAMEA